MYGAATSSAGSKLKRGVQARVMLVQQARILLAGACRDCRAAPACERIPRSSGGAGRSATPNKPLAHRCAPEPRCPPHGASPISAQARRARGAREPRSASGDAARRQPAPPRPAPRRKQAATGSASGSRSISRPQCAAKAISSKSHQQSAVRAVVIGEHQIRDPSARATPQRNRAPGPDRRDRPARRRRLEHLRPARSAQAILAAPQIDEQQTRRPR